MCVCVCYLLTTCLREASRPSPKMSLYKFKPEKHRDEGGIQTRERGDLNSWPGSWDSKSPSLLPLLHTSLPINQRLHFDISTGKIFNQLQRRAILDQTACELHQQRGTWRARTSSVPLMFPQVHRYLL